MREKTRAVLISERNHFALEIFELRKSVKAIDTELRRQEQVAQRLEIGRGDSLYARLRLLAVPFCIRDHSTGYSYVAVRWAIQRLKNHRAVMKGERSRNPEVIRNVR